MAGEVANRVIMYSICRVLKFNNTLHCDVNCITILLIILEVGDEIG
jgi:hypothetical protein